MMFDHLFFFVFFFISVLPSQFSVFNFIDSIDLSLFRHIQISNFNSLFQIERTQRTLNLKRTKKETNSSKSLSLFSLFFLLAFTVFYFSKAKDKTDTFQTDKRFYFKREKEIKDFKKKGKKKRKKGKRKRKVKKERSRNI